MYTSIYKHKLIYAIISNFKDIETFDLMKHICNTIKNKDETFEFDIDEEKRHIIIYDNDINKLHKRCMWLIHKADKHNTTVYDICKN